MYHPHGTASVLGFTWFAYPPPESQSSLASPISPDWFVGGSRNCSALSTCSSINNNVFLAGTLL
ncbi:hypothetical protein J6590_038733 [Homalodisca vitripennis]|nr:hypothetical protein J6590_038733 [Homalodisca vitripennis]